MEIMQPQVAPKIEKNNRKLVNGWAMYDWANSVYSLVITSSIFPIFFENATPAKIQLFGKTFLNSALYSYTLSFAFLVVALIIPLLSGIADYSGKKKSFMKVFCYTGGIACMGLYFFNPNQLVFGLLMVALAAIGYSGSQVFYNAYLPEIATHDRQDRVSAKGYALGYIGSMILLVINLAMIMSPDTFGLADDETPARISFVMVGLWWIGFAQISFLRLPANVFAKKVKGEYLYRGYLELRKVWFELKDTYRLKRYLIAFFIFNMGVQTVMYMAVIFGKNEIEGMPDSGLIISILIIQIIAVVGAYAFSWLSSVLSNTRALGINVFIWIAVCYVAYSIHTPVEFYMLAGLVGLVMGGIQSLSRSTYSKFLPETVDHASYFSFYEVCDKVGIVLGTFFFGFVFELTTDLRYSVLTIGSFFVVGLLLLFLVPKNERIRSN
ncbi:MAG TPA: MFS transporter [Cryomorphaceae bacterium]|nr:MFS transporter [Cryomorphaceae bacterium]